MVDPVIETTDLGFRWPTLDPFLFCVHHHDAYPAGDERMGPAAPLAGRRLGEDFAGIDGWNMYHGRVVPGFPQHPHRGFETVTVVRQGIVDHADSLGATARYGRGDVQWLTAGGGLVHSEMFPLLERDRPNPLEMFQIWVNLPAEDKLVDPHFTMLWSGDIPRGVVTDGDEPAVEVTVVAGPLGGLEPPPPPPRSWAARPDADVAIWELRLEPGAEWELPAADGPDTVRTLYLFEGSPLRVGERELGQRTGAVVRCDEPMALRAGQEAVACLVLQGRPIGEPVAQHGPFVMTDRAEIEQAFADYRRTGFGGWPWPSDDPVHDRDEGRFARHADGRVERVTSEPAA